MRVWVSIVLVLASAPSSESAESMKRRYLNADECYLQYIKVGKQHKDRDGLQKCIDKFIDIHRIDPKDPWAAAALFRAAEGYIDLFEITQKPLDRQNGVDLFNKIITDYKRSRYIQRAKERLDAINKEKPVPAQPAVKVEPPKKDPAVRHDAVPPPPTAETPLAGAAVAGEAAKECYRKLTTDETLMADRNNWLTCIDKLKAVHDLDSTGETGAESLYLGGKLYGELFKRSNQAEDKAAGLDLLSRVTKQHPASIFRKAAQDEFAAISERKIPPTPEKPIEPKPVKKKKSRPSKTKVVKASPASGLGTVTQLRFWSNPVYTRIVVDADRQTEFNYQLIDRDNLHDKPPRLFMDLKNCRLGKNADKLIPIDDNLLLGVRAGQYNGDLVRIVVDIKSFSRYKIFVLKDPFRIVLDVWGAATPIQQAAAPPPPHSAEPALQTPGPAPQTPGHGTQTPGPKEIPAVTVPPAKHMSLAKQLALGVRRIVIDPGHGGSDFGALGSIEGVYEKDIVLSIAKRLSAKIKESLGCEVILTRTDDRYLSLEERTAIANTKNADLFISIHTNSVKSQRAYGIETYYLNLATDDDAIMLAAKENATSTRNISDLQDILKDLMQNTKIHESSRLATYTQASMVEGLKRQYDKIKDKGVKQAPFYVLLGAQMPSILVETSFISNQRECERLSSDTYQDAIGDAIIAGIRSYIKETNPTALENRKHRSGTHG